MSRPIPRNDVEIEGRFVLLELGPHEQTKRSKKEFSVGKRRWYCRCSFAFMFVPYRNDFPSPAVLKRENPFFWVSIFPFQMILIVPFESCRQLSAVRVDEHTSVTLSTSSLFWDKCFASVTLKLTLFPENQPVVVHNRPGKISCVSYGYALLCNRKYKKV